MHSSTAGFATGIHRNAEDSSITNCSLRRAATPISPSEEGPQIRQEDWDQRCEIVDARPILPRAAFYMGDLRDGLPMVSRSLLLSSNRLCSIGDLGKLLSPLSPFFRSCVKSQPNQNFPFALFTHHSSTCKPRF